LPGLVHGAPDPADTLVAQPPPGAANEARSAVVATAALVDRDTAPRRGPRLQRRRAKVRPGWKAAPGPPGLPCPSLHRADRSRPAEGSTRRGKRLDNLQERTLCAGQRTALLFD